jgi:hypothetical protein
MRNAVTLHKIIETGNKKIRFFFNFLAIFSNIRSEFVLQCNCNEFGHGNSYEEALG